MALRCPLRQQTMTEWPLDGRFGSSSSSRSNGTLRALGICPAAYSAGVRTSHKMARYCISCRACAGVMRFWFLIQFAPFVQIQSKLYAPGKKFMI